jgi:hypothetical protein
MPSSPSLAPEAADLSLDGDSALMEVDGPRDVPDRCVVSAEVTEVGGLTFEPAGALAGSDGALEEVELPWGYHR